MLKNTWKNASFSVSVLSLIGFLVSVFFLSSIPQPLDVKETLVGHLCFQFFCAIVFVHQFYKYPNKLNFWIGIGASIFASLLYLWMPAFFNDFYRYLWDGKMTLNGINPYLYFPWAVHNSQSLQTLSQVWYWDDMYYRWTHTIYPPVSQMVFAMAAWLKEDSTLALKSIFFIANLGSLFLGYKILKHLKKPLYLLFLLVLNPIFLFETLATAHTEALHVCFFLLTMYLLVLKRPILLGISFASLILIKLFPIVYFPILFLGVLFLTSVKQGLLFTLSTIATIIALYFPFTLGVPSELLFESYKAFNSNWVLSPGLFDFVWRYGFLGTEAGYESTKHVLQSATIGIWVILGLRFIDKSRKQKDTIIHHIFETLFWITMTLMIFSSVVFSWYTLWLLPFVLLTKYKCLVWTWTIMFVFQYLLIFYDGIEHTTYKYLSNGDITSSQIFIWVPILSVLLMPYLKQAYEKGTHILFKSS